MPSVLVLNGPNLNMLGKREPAIYGSTTLADIEQLCRDTGTALRFDVVFEQSNHEGVLIEACHRARDENDGIVINAGGLTHTSVALMDALIAAELPIVEVHLSNIQAREEFRHHSFISPIAVGTICGFGLSGYRMALEAMADIMSARE